MLSLAGSPAGERRPRPNGLHLPAALGPAAHTRHSSFTEALGPRGRQPHSTGPWMPISGPGAQLCSPWPNAEPAAEKGGTSPLPVCPPSLSPPGPLQLREMDCVSLGCGLPPPPTCPGTLHLLLSAAPLHRAERKMVSDSEATTGGGGVRGESAAIWSSCAPARSRTQPDPPSERQMPTRSFVIVPPPSFEKNAGAVSPGIRLCRALYAAGASETPAGSI